MSVLFRCLFIEYYEFIIVVVNLQSKDTYLVIDIRSIGYIKYIKTICVFKGAKNKLNHKLLIDKRHIQVLVEKIRGAPFPLFIQRYFRVYPFRPYETYCLISCHSCQNWLD